MNERNAKGGAVTGEVITVELIEDFIETMRKKNRGESSLDTYRRILTSIYQWLQEDKVLYEKTGTKRR